MVYEIGTLKAKETNDEVNRAIPQCPAQCSAQINLCGASFWTTEFRNSIPSESLMPLHQSTMTPRFFAGWRLAVETPLFHKILQYKVQQQQYCSTTNSLHGQRVTIIIQHYFVPRKSLRFATGGFIQTVDLLAGGQCLFETEISKAPIL